MESNLKETGCCCHKEEAHAPAEKEASCCHAAHKPPEEPPKEEGACCCHTADVPEKNPQKEEHGSCCHASHAVSAAEKTDACCHTADVPEKNPQKEEHGSCCHASHAVSAAEETGSCCHIGQGGAASAEEGGLCGCCSGKDYAAEDKKKRKKELIRSLVFLAVSLAGLIVSFIEPFHDAKPVVRLFDFAWVSILLCGIPIYRSAFRGLRKKKITSSLLISTAMTASIVIGVLSLFGVGGLGGHGEHMENYFFVAGEVAFLMAIGELIEDITVGKARSGIQGLIALKPTLASLKTENGYQEVDVSALNVGDVVLMRPNEAVSIDGVMLSPYASVNEANITGESTPKDKKAGDPVFAGTVNLDTAFEAEVTKLAGETTLNKLIDYVKRAEREKAPIVRLADRWASYLVPSSILLSCIVFLVTFFGMKVGAVEAVGRAVTILVVVCPCALALATPVAISAGIGNASRKGVLIKSGIALEALAKADTVAFDKTGTLTEGKLQVESVYVNQMTEKEMLFYAASAELQSEHPIAKAIVAHAKEGFTAPESTESMQGVGVKATVNGKNVRAVKLSDANAGAWYQPKPGAYTAVAVEIDGTVEGVIHITDTVRKGAGEAVRALNQAGFATVMLTGDNDMTAKTVAETVGVTAYHANLLPEDKVQYVDKFKKSGKKVLMVGDGVNDAPALAMADCSVSMGAMGNSVAIETADISLMESDLSRLPFLTGLAKRTMTIIRINITMSLTLNILAVILSMFGLLNVVAGALLHNVSSVLVCTNAALLLLYKGGKRKKKEAAGTNA